MSKGSFEATSRLSEPESGRDFDTPTIDTLAACEDEPIHIPGAVQPHGVLFEVVDDDAIVTRVTSNVRSAVGRGASTLLGHSLAAVFGDDAVAWARETVAAIVPATHAALRRTLADGRAGTLLLHRYHGRTIVEWLADEEHRFATPDRLDRELAAGLARARQAGDVGVLLDHVAEAVKIASGYDRVMIYRFHPDWHGEIVAERTEPGLVGYRGLHYPASDIPAQARRLYVDTRARAICDVYARDAVLMTAPTLDPAEPELDLSHAVSRSVSPVHIQYLRNMGTGATLVTSLIVHGALWGLIACHHRTRYPVPWYAFGRLRRFTDEVSAALEQRIGELAEARTRAQDAGRRTLTEVLAASVAQGLAQLAALLAADGHVVLAGGKLVRSPGLPASAERLIAAVLAKADDIGTTDALAETFQGAAAEPGCAGLAWLVVAREPAVVVALVRPEFQRTVTWGGDPDKAVHRDVVTQRLSPRGSFDLWKETVRGQSRPWEDDTRVTLEAFRRVVDVGALAEFVARESA